MFTGIVNGLGRICSLEGRKNEARFAVEPLYTMSFLNKGESISINGVCLTVEEHMGNQFTVYASPTTLETTNLGKLKAGSVVNLERSLSLGERLGGHIVTGHIDGVVQVLSVTKQEESHRIRFSYPSQFTNEIATKGSIALDGISLTVANCDSTFFEVTIIPTTWKVTTVSQWRAGAFVNMETDIVGKYVCKMVSSIMSSEKNSPCANPSLTLNFLREHGFS